MLGELRAFGSADPPAGWHVCDGTTVDIHKRVPLASLIGTIYGGDGLRTFALPDLRGLAIAGSSDEHLVGQHSAHPPIETKPPATLPFTVVTWAIALEGSFPSFT